jgi:hypothetical protein
LYFLWFKTFLILLIVTNRWITENWRSYKSERQRLIKIIILIFHWFNWVDAFRVSLRSSGIKERKWRSLKVSVVFKI